MGALKVLLVASAAARQGLMAATVADLLERGYDVEHVDATAAGSGSTAVRRLRPDVILFADGDAPNARRDVMNAARGCHSTVVVLPHVFGTNGETVPPDERPDWVMVATDADRNRAIERYGLPASRVITIGALEYDSWFLPDGVIGREAFCRSQHIDPQRPFVVYRAAAVTTPEELQTVDAWRRTPSKESFDVVFIVPDTGAESWGRVAGGGRVIRDDRSNIDPVRSAIAHALAVVTSEPRHLVEPVIMRRPAHLFLRDRDNGYALVPVARWLRGDLTASTSGALTDAEASLPDSLGLQWIESTVRPYGCDISAAAMTARAIGKIALLGPFRPATPPRGWFLLAPIVRRLESRAEKQAATSPPEPNAGKEKAAKRFGLRREREQDRERREIRQAERTDRLDEKAKLQADKAKQRIEKDRLILAKREAKRAAEKAEKMRAGKTRLES